MVVTAEDSVRFAHYGPSHNLLRPALRNSYLAGPSPCPMSEGGHASAITTILPPKILYEILYKILYKKKTIYVFTLKIIRMHTAYSFHSLSDFDDSLSDFCPFQGQGVLQIMSKCHFWRPLIRLWAITGLRCAAILAISGSRGNLV